MSRLVRLPRLKQPPHAGGVTHSTDPLIEVAPIDGFRGFAALMIATYHAWLLGGSPAVPHAAEALLSAGYIAVPFFFVISGFVLFLPTCRRDGDFGSVRSYAIRRVARICPAYYALLAVLFLAWPLVLGRLLPGATWPATTKRGWEVLAAHVTFLHHELISWWRFGPFPATGFGWTGVLWSLSVEAVFYVVLPLVAYRFWRHPFLLLACAFAVELAWRIADLHLPGIVYHLGFGVLDPGDALTAGLTLFTQFPSYTGQLALGMTTAWVYVRAFREPGGVYALIRRYAPVLCVVGSVVVVAALYRAGSLNFGGPTVKLYAQHPHDELPALGFAVLILGTALARGGWAWLWANPVSRWLGVVSYGVYLWHLVVMVSIIAWFYPRPHPSIHLFAVMFFVGIPIAIAIAWISYRVIELPAMRASRRLTHARVSVRPSLEPAP